MTNKPKVLWRGTRAQIKITSFYVVIIYPFGSVDENWDPVDNYQPKAGEQSVIKLNERKVNEDALRCRCGTPWLPSYYHLRSSVNGFFRAGLLFKRGSFPRQLYRRDQWKCFVWSTQLWMFVAPHEQNVLHFFAGLTKLTTFFRVLEAWCHCDFRKMEALKEKKKIGRTFLNGTQTANLSIRPFLARG